ncbi:unnamed protein product [Brassica rapa subsp. trilocularis]
MRFHRAGCPKPAVVPSLVYCHSYSPRRRPATIKRRDPYEDSLPNPSHRNRLCISAFSQVRATMCSSFFLPFRSESTPDKKPNKENRHLQVSTAVNMLSPNRRYKP